MPWAILTKFSGFAGSFIYCQVFQFGWILSSSFSELTGFKVRGCVSLKFSAFTCGDTSHFRGPKMGRTFSVIIGSLVEAKCSMFLSVTLSSDKVCECHFAERDAHVNDFM